MIELKVIDQTSEKRKKVFVRTSEILMVSESDKPRTCKVVVSFCESFNTCNNWFICAEPYSTVCKKIEEDQNKHLRRLDKPTKEK